jgi:hypothetical protein
VKKLKVLLAALIFTTSACSKEALSPLASALDIVTGYAEVDAHFCTSAPSPAKQYLKYLFIIDHSASNQPGFPNPLTPLDITNTDSQGSRRYGPMINFIQNLAPDPNNITSFGLIDFADSATQPGTVVGFDDSATDFISLATTDWIGTGTALAPEPVDGGFTNYQSALNLALSLIQSDAEVAAALNNNPFIATSYQIIFVTDGVPTVQQGAGVYTQTFATDISPVISSIMNLKNNPVVGKYISNIVLNTAYYFNAVSDASAISLLQQMSAAGNGLYIQFGSGQNILYQSFVPPARNIVNELADVFVQNENAVWWDDGRFLADTDGDGLPDLIEQQFGSDPNVKDTDGNGVSDLIEYRTKGKPCSDAACLPANRDQYSFCAGYSPTTDVNNRVTFSSSANDGMNDCEKFIMGGLVSNFNSNGDLIPDLYAVINTLPILPGTANTAFADPFGDHITNYSKLKLGLPIQVSTSAIPGYLSRTTSLTPETSPLLNSTCYHLVVNNVALTATANTIKVMVIQNGSTLQDKPFLMYAEGAVGDNTGITFVNSDFH